MNPQLSVLRFSPDPEEIEYINVALLFENGRTNLVYENTFPRLACLLPSFDTKLLVYYLQDIQARISSESFSHAKKLIASESSQFIFTETQNLIQPVSKDLIHLLIMKYLGRTKQGLPSQQKNRVETKLNRYLIQNLSIAQDCILCRVAPKDFLSSNIVEKLGSNGIRIARSVKTQHHILLVDGIDCDPDRIESVEGRAQRIASNYFRLGRCKKDIQSEGQELKRISVLLNKPWNAGNDRLGYVIKMLNEESDLLINPKEKLSPWFQDWMLRLRSEMPQSCLF